MTTPRLSHFRWLNHTESRYDVNVAERGTCASTERWTVWRLSCSPITQRPVFHPPDRTASLGPHPVIHRSGGSLPRFELVSIRTHPEPILRPRHRESQICRYPDGKEPVCWP